MFKYLFKRDTILATLMVFMVMGLLAFIPFNTHVLDPVKLALQDFDYNDLAYSQLHKNSNRSTDTNIVIVNIGESGRSEIAEMIELILAQQPAVLGVDVLFADAKDSAADNRLRNLFTANPTLVVSYNFDPHPGGISNGYFYTAARSRGYANFVGEDAGCIRHFAPFMHIAGTQQSLAAAMMQIADPRAYNALLDRRSKTEQINYARTADEYLVIDRDELSAMDSNGQQLAGKIVLLGYLPASPFSLEDKHFTPLNTKSVGKSVPDMQGVVIHANILSMIRDGQYINKWPSWLLWTIAVVLCWLHMAIFIRYFLDNHLWFHLVAKTAQIISAIVIVYLGLLFFFKWDIKINLTPSFIAIILAVDVLYFYEAIVGWLHKKFGVHSLFVHHAH